MRSGAADASLRETRRRPLSFAIRPVTPTEGSTRPSRPLELALPTVRRRYGGLIASLLFHALLVAFVVRTGERLWSRTLAPGDPALAPGGGGSGGPRVAYITLPPAPRSSLPRQTSVTAPAVHPRVDPEPKPALAVPPPTLAQPEPAPIPPPVDTQPPAPAAASAGPETTAVAGAAPGVPGGTGGGAGPGIGPSSGPGAGPGPGGGSPGGAIRPPELRDLAFPFDTPPKELRGASLAVTFWVRDDGRVERYVVNPEIGDRDYARKFDEVIRAFRFTPARSPNGSLVAGTTTVTFTLPGKRSS